VTIEDDKSIAVLKNTKRAASGRKPKHESRAAEFRQALIAWRRQIPESSRPSLRALAAGLSTTHQTLGYYLNGLDRWRAEEEAKQIRARRYLTLAPGRMKVPKTTKGAQ
jgi:hypothetical protein